MGRVTRYGYNPDPWYYAKKHTAGKVDQMMQSILFHLQNGELNKMQMNRIFDHRASGGNQVDYILMLMEQRKLIKLILRTDRRGRLRRHWKLLFKQGEYKCPMIQQLQ